MKQFCLIILLVFSACMTGFSQDERVSEVKFIALPIYPTPAIILGIEETISVEVLVDQYGKVVSLNTSTKRPYFASVIEEAIEEWRFFESDDKLREMSFTFVFKLLPYDSKSNIGSSFAQPNVIEIYAKKAKILNP